MNGFMAIGTFWYGGVFVLMTECTVELSMLAGIGGQVLENISMTEAAVLRRNIIGIGNV